MEPPELLRADALHRRYARVHAVRGVDLVLARGEVLGLLGPNGAGKTTTLAMIAGVLAPSAGTVRILGLDLGAEPIAAKSHVGYLPEQPPLYPELTVVEYLRHCARLRGLGGRALATAAADAVERCGLGESRARLIGNLSKGFRQRVGIAQAIVHRPALVMLDEPTSGLDPIQIREIRALIRELGRDHGVILSTHVLPEVQGACDRVAILAAGRVALDAPLAGIGEGGERATLIEFRDPPAVEALRAVAGVDQATALGGGRFRLRHRDERVAEALVRRALAGGWGLREMTPERRSLEEVFVALTCGEEDALVAEDGR